MVTLEYGFLITPMFGRTDHSASWDAFVEKIPEQVFGQTVPYLYTYPKREEMVRGVKISTELNRFPFPGDCDLAIYFHEVDKIHHIRDQVYSCWDVKKRSKRQTVGEQENYMIAFYVDRSQCSPTHVLEKLKLQVEWLNSFKSSRCILHERSLGKVEWSNSKLWAEAKERTKNSIRTIKLVEGLTAKRLELEVENFRRAIGLYLWDTVNDEEGVQVRSKLSVIMDIIYTLKDKKKEKGNGKKRYLLSVYYKNYGRVHSKEVTKGALTRITLFKDKPSVIEKIGRDMYDDYYVADFCMKNFDYISLEQMKRQVREDKLREMDFNKYWENLKKMKGDNLVFLKDDTSNTSFAPIAYL